MEHRLSGFSKQVLNLDWKEKSCPGAVVPERMIMLDHLKNRRLTGGMIVKYSLILSFIEPRSRILDACCGGAWGSYHLARSGHNVVGIDKDGYMLEISNEREHENLEIFERDLFTMNVGLFDAITFVDAIEHFTQEDQIVIMKQLDKHLKPGGILLIDTPWGEEKSRRTSGAHLWELNWKDFGDLVESRIDFEWRRRYTVRYEHGFSLLTEMLEHPGYTVKNEDQIIVLRKNG